jgi:hypothetical protein
LESGEQEKKHMDHRFFVIPISVNNDDWYPDCVVSASSMRTYARRKKTFALRSFILMDGTQQDHHAFFFYPD